jgi:ABC-2 type transport system permease protein
MKIFHVKVETSIMIPSRFKVIFDVTKKEIFEHFKTMRLIVISIIFIIVFFIIMYVGHHLVGGDVPVYKRGANEALSVLLAFSSLFPPILAVALGYDTIVGERTRRSLHLVLSKPVDRSSIYIGKFLGVFLSISFIYVVVCTIGYLVVIGASGKVPSSMDVGRAYAAIGILLLSVACWILFVMLFSTSFKTITSTLIFSVIFWLFIMNLASNIGLIYYLVTLETGDETVAIDILNIGESEGSETTSIMFWAHNVGVPVLDIKYEVFYENTNLVEPVRGSSIFAMFSFYQLNPGNYSWRAYQYDSESDSTDKIGEGSFYFGSGFNPFMQLTSFDNDGYYDDVLLLVGSVTFEEGQGYDLTVKNIENDAHIITRTDFSGPYFIQNLSEGDYEIEIKKNNTVLFKNKVHSFGKEEAQGGFLVVSDDELEFPDYVKVTFAMNPDNAASVSYGVLTGSDSTGIISLEEGLTALLIEFFALIFLGLLIFSRIELL